MDDVIKPWSKVQHDIKKDRETKDNNDSMSSPSLSNHSSPPSSQQSNDISPNFNYKMAFGDDSVNENVPLKFCKVFLMHGFDDKSTPYTQSIDMHKQLKKLDVESQIKIYQNCGHLGEF